MILKDWVTMKVLFNVQVVFFLHCILSFYTKTISFGLGINIFHNKKVSSGHGLK